MTKLRADSVVKVIMPDGSIINASVRPINPDTDAGAVFLGETYWPYVERHVVEAGDGWTARPATEADYAAGRVDGTLMPREIDLTPSWTAVLPIWLAVYRRGGKTAPEALVELRRMAALADLYVASQRGK